MNKAIFEEFLESADKLRIYHSGTLLFSSREDMLKPLLRYIRENETGYQNITVFDKIMGNAAALLCVIAHCNEVYSPLGSEPAIRTLGKYGIKYHINNIVPYIVKPDGVTLCPMEKLSLDKSPQEFYQVVSAGTNKS